MIGWQDAATGAVVAASAAYLLWRGAQTLFRSGDGGCGGCGSGCKKGEVGTGGKAASTPVGEPLVALGPPRPRRNGDAPAVGSSSNGAAP